jgi:hypothetical protein
MAKGKKSHELVDNDEVSHTKFNLDRTSTEIWIEIQFLKGLTALFEVTKKGGSVWLTHKRRESLHIKMRSFDTVHLSELRRSITNHGR